MQIQKWIASLTHLFFLILGLTGICLMYIHGNFGLGLTIRFTMILLLSARAPNCFI